MPRFLGVAELLMRHGEEGEVRGASAFVFERLIWSEREHFEPFLIVAYAVVGHAERIQEVAILGFELTASSL